jgi:hypothetical protein
MEIFVISVPSEEKSPRNRLWRHIGMFPVFYDRNLHMKVKATP